MLEGRSSSNDVGPERSIAESCVPVGTFILDETGRAFSPHEYVCYSWTGKTACTQHHYQLFYQLKSLTDYYEPYKQSWSHMLWSSHCAINGGVSLPMGFSKDHSNMSLEMIPGELHVIRGSIIVVGPRRGRHSQHAGGHMRRGHSSRGWELWGSEHPSASAFIVGRGRACK